MGLSTADPIKCTVCKQTYWSDKGHVCTPRGLIANPNKGTRRTKPKE